jgi:hypothetical protein
VTANVEMSDLLTQSLDVPGGKLYISTLCQGRDGGRGEPISVAQTFVPTAQGGLSRPLALTSAKSDAGVALTATATGGAMGVKRTAGASLVLAGEVTSSNAKTDSAIWELDVPDSYVAGQAIPVKVNANFTGAGTVTAISTTLTLAAYTEVNGVEAAVAGITAAQAFTNAATDYTFTIPGAAGLVAGQRIVVEVVMLVTTASGANTGQINNVAITA